MSDRNDLLVLMFSNCRCLRGHPLRYEEHSIDQCSARDVRGARVEA
jgi:hypothetical protein